MTETKHAGSGKMEESAFMKRVAGQLANKCQCSMSISVLGDGCRYCQPAEYIDRLGDELDDLRKQVESMGSMSLAEAVVSELRDYNAENYKESTIEITFDDGSESVNAVVTLQRIGKPTAHMLRLEAEAERDELLAALEVVSSALDTYEVMIDGEWGSARSLDEIESDGDLDETTLMVRALINKSRSKAK